MNSKERFLAALRGELPDRVPVWDFINNPALYKDVLGSEIFFIDGHEAVRLYREIGLDGVFIPVGGYNALIDAHWDWFADTQFRDDWGTIFTFEESAWPCAFPVEYQIKTRQDWERLIKPDPKEDWRYQTIQDALQENQQSIDRQIAVVAGIRGPFSTASMILGMTQLSLLLYDDPDLLKDILQSASLFWSEIAAILIRLGVDAIVIVDDMGANQQTLISPKHLRNLVLPILKEEVQVILDADIPVFLHSCGNVSTILPDIIGTGVLGLNNIQQAAGMDLKAIKETFGKRLCLVGNVNASEVMAYGTTSDVRQAVKDCIQIASPGGSHILATDHSFHKGIPLENVYAFIEAGRRFGVYDAEGFPILS